MGILDTIILTKQADTLQNFKPTELVRAILSQLKERDRKILIHRYGLEGNPIKTLAAIGVEHKLTRERVRQIEKELIKNLKKHTPKLQEFSRTKDFLLSTITEHGKILSEPGLLSLLDIRTEEDKNATVFLLNLIEELESYLHANYKKCWVTVLFNPSILHEFTEIGNGIFQTHGKPMKSEDFVEKIKQTSFYQTHSEALSQKVILNFLDLAHKAEQNVFGHWGLVSWKEINPKDVGDKAYLVLKHHGKPEHYARITDIINEHKFDHRKAYKETVHNELIKDPRFILIGRGIYALLEWGYKSGVVADVITEILQQAGKPLAREQIIEEVLKRRIVKKNTILVGLSNKKLFKKVGKNLYSLV